MTENMDRFDPETGAFKGDFFKEGVDHDITYLAQELLEIQGNQEDAKILAEDAPTQIREQLMEEIDRLAEESHQTGKDW
jgi:hypothetical protein